MERQWAAPDDVRGGRICGRIVYNIRPLTNRTIAFALHAPEKNVGADLPCIIQALGLDFDAVLVRVGRLSAREPELDARPNSMGVARITKEVGVEPKVNGLGTVEHLENQAEDANIALCEGRANSHEPEEHESMQTSRTT